MIIKGLIIKKVIPDSTATMTSILESCNFSAITLIMERKATGLPNVVGSISLKMIPLLGKLIVLST